MEYLKRSLRWVNDYFIKCHTAPNEFYGQVGNGGTDHAWWGSAEVMQMERPADKIDASNPGSDLAAETAAVMAAASILFQFDDPAYSQTLLEHAEQLYSFAVDQLHYALGDNPNNRSYVCGFGNNPPVNPHHRTAHGCWSNNHNGPPEETRHVLYGALVGGPNDDDSYEDERSNYINNEVACDYNAGSYTVILTVDDGELTDTDNINIVVTETDDSPVASIDAAPTAGIAPLTVSFDASGSSDPNNDPLTYAWDFGDGSTGSGIAPEHTYTSEGNYTATVTVSDGELSDQASINITVGTTGECEAYTAISLPFVQDVKVPSAG